VDSPPLLPPSPSCPHLSLLWVKQREVGEAADSSDEFARGGTPIEVAVHHCAAVCSLASFLCLRSSLPGLANNKT
jgi:hypothetical protein